jgi:RimJ/RimL family protein N-acetyltransferase
VIVVETGRLVLRRLAPADAGDLAPIFADPEVMRLAGGALAGRRGLVRYAAAFDPL